MRLAPKIILIELTRVDSRQDMAFQQMRNAKQEEVLRHHFVSHSQKRKKKFEPIVMDSQTEIYNGI